MDALIKDQRFISLVKEISQEGSQEPVKEPVKEPVNLQKYSNILKTQLLLKTFEDDLDPKSFGSDPHVNLSLYGRYIDMKNHFLSDKGIFFKLNVKDNTICSITSKSKKDTILAVGDKLELDDDEQKHAFKDADYICYTYESVTIHPCIENILKNTFDECFIKELKHTFMCFCFIKI